jgi:hypothetical protein
VQIDQNGTLLMSYADRISAQHKVQGFYRSWQGSEKLIYRQPHLTGKLFRYRLLHAVVKWEFTG